MLSIDTNVIVRFLTADDAIQFRRAEALISGNEIKITTTVLLETAWVLRSRYQFSPPEIVDAIDQLARLPQVTLESWPITARALEFTRNGLDIADAFHLAASADCNGFVTFDEACLATAARLGLPAHAP